VNAKTKSQAFFWLLVSGIFLLVCFTIFYNLEVRPLHHDEGINGWFIDGFIKSGKYKYSPKHYHGPTLFHLGRIFSKVLGLSTHTIRLIPAIFTLILCLTPLFLIKKWNKTAIITTGLLLAITPANLFYGRYAIHEMIFVSFFTVSALFLVLYFFQEVSIAIFFAGIFLACAAASKETVVVSFCAIFFGLFIASYFHKKENDETSVSSVLKERGKRLIPFTLLIILFFGLSYLVGLLFVKKLSHLQNIQPFLIIFFIALLFGIFKLDYALDKLPSLSMEEIKSRFSWRKIGEPIIYLGCFFFATYIIFRVWFKPKELYEFFHSYVFYLDLGAVKTGHAKPWTYFWGLLFRYEWLVFLTAIGGAIVALVQRKKMDLFFLGWAVSILGAYSFISYKTPWIIINITVPLAFLGGCFIHFLMENIKKKDLKVLVLLTFTMMATVTLFKSWALSHRIYNDIDNKYFYVHTQPSTHELERRLKTLLDANPDESLAIVSPEHWPFPFLLKDYDRVGYWGRIPENLDSKIILAQDKQHDDLPGYVVNTFQFEKYVLRGGVNLELFYSKELKL